MNPLITTLEPSAPPFTAHEILASGGYHATVLAFSPGGGISDETDSANDRIYVGCDGTVMINSAGVSTYLHPQTALLVPKGTAHSLQEKSNQPAKVLRLDIPPRHVTTAPLVTLSS